jgi:ApbE superfamily uncharacterized protein (UPF0280 family)
MIYTVRVEHLCSEACEIEIEADSKEQAIELARQELLADAQWEMTDYIGDNEYEIVT